MDKMLNHLSEESKQAAATTLVSSPPQPGPRARQQPQLPAQLSWDMGFLLPPLTAWYPPTPTAHQRGRPVPHLLRTPHLGHLQALLPQIVQVSSSYAQPPPGLLVLGGAHALSSSVPEPASTST